MFFLRGYITYLLNMIHKYIWEKRNQYLTYMFKLNIELKFINELMTMLTKTHSNWYYDFDGWKKKSQTKLFINDNHIHKVRKMNHNSDECTNYSI